MLTNHNTRNDIIIIKEKRTLINFIVLQNEDTNNNNNIIYARAPLHDTDTDADTENGWIRTMKTEQSSQNIAMDGIPQTRGVDIATGGCSVRFLNQPIPPLPSPPPTRN